MYDTCIDSNLLILYSVSNATMDQRNKSIVLAGLAVGVGLAAGAFLAVSFAKSQSAKAKIERRRSDTDPVSMLLLHYIFRSSGHLS